jgi:predicted nucleic-acid-binding protein
VTGLDTNILIRYLVQDDSVQSPKAGAIIESFTAEQQGYICLPALVEMVWVLTSCYDMEKAGLLSVLDLLLRTRTLLLAQADAVRRAVDLFRSSKADFEDCLILHCCDAARCKETVTFDVGAAKMAGMRLIR